MKCSQCKKNPVFIKKRGICKQCYGKAYYKGEIAFGGGESFRSSLESLAERVQKLERQSGRKERKNVRVRGV